MSSSSPAGGLGVPGLAGILLLASLPLVAEEAERLFLSDERFKPPPFASRLFRPPRRA